MKDFYIQYTYVFQLGMNEHRISFYKGYKVEQGLEGDRFLTLSCSNKAFLFETLREHGIKIPKKQKTRLDSLMKYREDGIVGPLGEFYKY